MKLYLSYKLYPAADHESVGLSLLEPFQLIFLADTVSHNHGYNGGHQPVQEKTARMEILDSGQINQFHTIHIYTAPSLIATFTSSLLYSKNEFFAICPGHGLAGGPSIFQFIELLGGGG